jgi:DNA repair exonuclease SbcCD ATPase subunit
LVYDQVRPQEGQANHNNLSRWKYRNLILEFARRIIINFGSFLGEHELDLASFGPGLHFVKGDNQEEPRLSENGCGKSMAIANAPCWCLYGKTADGRRNPDIEPRFGDKHTTVTEHLLIDGKPRTVTRTTHPNRLLLDGKEVGQEQIDALLGLSFETFTHTVLLGQGRPLFFDLQPKAKMDLFSSVLNLDRWEARSEAASAAVSSLSSRESTLVGELTGMEAQLDQLDTLLEAARASWRGWRDERDRVAAAEKERLSELLKRSETLERERAGYDLAFDGAETELKAVQDAIRKLTVEIERLTAERFPLTTQIALHKEKARSLRAELEDLGEADECPTCGQSLKGTNLNKHKAELNTELKTVTKKLASTEAAHARVTKEINDFQRTRASGCDAEANFKTRSNIAKNRLISIAPQLADLNAQIAQIKSGAKKQEREANPYTDQINGLKRKIKDLEGTYKEQQDRLKRLSEQIERTRFWIKGFKEVRLYVIEEVLQELELTTNAALAEVGLVDWIVQYSIEKETKSGTIQRGLNVFIQSPKDKAPVKWECWSGGEGQRLRLVGALALSEVLLARANVEPKMEVLDEPTRGLSDEGIIDLGEYLADRAKQLDRQCWYIDHRVVENARFSSVLTVVKTTKGSELVV